MCLSHNGNIIFKIYVSFSYLKNIEEGIYWLTQATFASSLKKSPEITAHTQSNESEVQDSNLLLNL